MNNKPSSQIRVFLSSTFADMQEERDALVKLFRILSNEGRKRGIDIKLIDLRWGITDDQKRNGKVISTCFQEIDNTRPFFIGIVGDRYGWVPSQEEIEANKELCDRFPIVRNFSKEGLSITEMEMRYGLLSANTQDDSLFLIKSNCKTENIRHHQLKEFLTNSLISHASYSTIDELTNIVERKILDLIDKASPDVSNLTELERFEFESDKHIRENSTGFIEYGDTLSKLDEWVNNKDQYIVVSGEAGSGKSSVISYWLRTRNINRRKLIAYFVDDKDGVDSTSEIQRFILTRFEEEYGFPHTPKEKTWIAGVGYEYYKNEIDDTLKIAQDKGDQWLIVIDGLNQLENDITIKQLHWLPDFPKTIKILLSTTPDDFTHQILCTTKRYRELTITLPDKDVRAEIIRRHLAKVGKALDEKYISDIVNAPLYHNPEMLHLLMDELVSYGIHEEIPNHIARYVSSLTKKEFYRHILIHAEEYYGSTLIKDVASLLSVTQGGLTEEAIIKILNIEPIDWSMVYCGLQRLLSCINGKYHFVDTDMNELVNEYFYGNASPNFSRTQKYSLRIISYLEKENTDLMELAFQYALCDNWEKVYQFLIDPKDMLPFLIHKENLFIAYWVNIIQNTSHTPAEYLTVDFQDHDGWDAEIQISILSRVMEFHFSKLDFAITMLEKASDIIQKKMIQPGADKGYLANILATTYSHIASNYTTLCEFDKTKDYLVKAEQICLSVGEPVNTMIYTAKGNLFFTIGDYKAALDNHKLAYETEIAHNKYDDIKIDYKYPANLGLAYSYIGNYKMALKHLEEALDIIRLKSSIISVYSAGVLNNIGQVYQKTNRHSEALNYFSMARKGYEHDGAERSRDMAILLNNIGVSQQFLNNLDKAIETLKEAYGIHKEADPESMEYAICALNLGNVLTLKSQYADAIPYLREGVGQFWNNVELSNSYLGMGAICLIEAYTFNHQYADAEGMINSLGQRAFEELGNTNWIIAHCHYRRAILYKTAGIDKSFIIEEYRNARSIFQQLNETGMVADIDSHIQTLYI